MIEIIQLQKTYFENVALEVMQDAIELKRPDFELSLVVLEIKNLSVPGPICEQVENGAAGI